MMPPKSFKTSDDQFQVFKSSVIYWMAWFGLKSWEVSIDHNDRHLENRATCEPALGARMVTFTLTKSRWHHKPDDRELRLLGFHEVCECLLTELTHWAESRRPEGDLQDITHNLIRTLENSVFHTLDTPTKTS